jgi:putative FmdB family regulatory protein
MPTYEYICPKCGHEFDLFQSMNDAPIKRCPKCKKLGVKRLIGKGAGLIFKGSGFYITDYRKTPFPKEGGEGKAGAGEGKPTGGEAKAPGGEGKSGGGDGKSAAGDGKSGGGEAKPADPPKSSSDAKSSAGTKPAATEKPKGDKKN